MSRGMLLTGLCVFTLCLCGACLAQQQAGFTERVNIVFGDGTAMVYRGAKQGLGVGQVYSVSLQGREVTRIELTRVEDNFCVVKIVANSGLREGELYSFAPVGAAAPGPADGKPADKKDSGKADAKKPKDDDKSGGDTKKETKPKEKKDKKDTEKKDKAEKTDKTENKDKDAGKAKEEKKDAGTAAKPAAGGTQAFVPVALNKGEIITIIQGNQMVYSDVEDLEFRFNYSDSSSGSGGASYDSKNLKTTLSYERLKDRAKNGVWINADLTYEDQKSNGSTSDGSWSGFAEYGFKSYLSETGQNYWHAKARIERKDSIYNIIYYMGSAVISMPVSMETTTKLFGVGYGFGRPLGVGAWRNAKDIEGVLIKHGLIKEALPKKTFVRIVDAATGVRGNILAKAGLVKRIHDILVEEKVLSSKDFDITVSFEITKILDTRMQNLIDAIEVRADYDYTSTKTKSFAFGGGDSKYKGSITALEVIYWSPLSDVLQLKFNPKYQIVNNKSDGDSWKQKILKADLTLNYGLSDIVDLQAAYNYETTKQDGGGKNTSKLFTLALIYKIW